MTDTGKKMEAERKRITHSQKGGWRVGDVCWGDPCPEDPDSTPHIIIEADLTP